MDTRADLKHIQNLLMDRVSSAVSNRNFASVTRLSGLLKECEVLETEFTSLQRRVDALRSALNGSSTAPSAFSTPIASADTRVLSPKAAGAQARHEWAAGLRAKGISLTGHGKRYQSVRGESVAVAFANELSGLEDRWFLGLADEPTDIAVLLCNSLAGKLYDVVMPVARLHDAWRDLSRHRGQVKLNFRRDGNQFFLLVPGKKPVAVTQYVGNYDPLR